VCVVFMNVIFENPCT